MMRPALKKWPLLTRLGTLCLGLGALLAGAARANTSDVQPPGSAVPLAGRDGATSNEVLIRIVGEQVLISQNGNAFEELALGNTPEAVYLKKLLREAAASDGSISIPVGSIIVANGGGGADGHKPKRPGKSQSPPKKPGTAKPEPHQNKANGSATGK